MFCTHCGTPSPEEAGFCRACGNPLVIPGGPPTAPQAPAAPLPPPPPMPYSPAYGGTSPQYYQWAQMAEVRKEMDRTKIGLLLIVIGFILGVIPLVGLFGALLMLIGALFVILGRRGFGAVHARNVIVALVLFFVSIAAMLGVVVWAAASAVPYFAPGSRSPNDPAFLDAFLTSMVEGLLVVGVLAGLMVVLFTYALQDVLGKSLLWGAYAISTMVQVIVVVLVVRDHGYRGAFYAGSPTPFASVGLFAAVPALAALGLVPGIMNAVAYGLAWARVNRGEIPRMPTQYLSAPAIYPVPPPGGG